MRAVALKSMLALSLLVAAGRLWAQQSGNSIADLEPGARLFEATCSVCHGPIGDAVQGIDFAKGRFKRVSSDADLAGFIQKGIPGTAMPPFDLRPRELESLVAYLHSLRESAAHPSIAGDESRGKALFEGKGGCLACHRIRDRGSRLGPDLTGIGKIRPPSAIQESLLDPGAVVLPEHLFCTAVTREGVTITGRRLNEDPNTVQLIDEQDRLISLDKSALREYKLLKTSSMPSYKDKFTPGEIADIVKYLSEQRGAASQ